MTGGYRLVEKYEIAYHFIVAGRPAIGANRWIFSEKKSKVGPKNLIRFHIALNLGEKCFFFAIQNLVDIQSSRFW